MHDLRLHRLLLLAVLLVVGVSTVYGQETTETIFDGYLDRQVPEKTYPIMLEAGQAILVVTEATSGDLDTVVSIYGPGGDLVAQNDDRSDATLDSAVGYRSDDGGPYKVLISRYPEGNSSGAYRLRIVIGGPEVLDELASLTRIQLSGTAQILETPNFRIHYTMSGHDAAPSQDYVETVAAAAEEAWQVQVGQMGWPVPPGDGILGGDERFDIYVKDLLGAGEEALGYAVPDVVVGDNPNTAFVEGFAAGSYLVVENDFADAGGDGSPLGLLRTTVIHELNHALQFGFDAADPHNWMYEATATWMETAAAGKDQDATGYVIDAYEYPELCFGTVDDPNEGAVQYGEWPFIQMMVDELGPDSIVRYWEHVAAYDGWAALEETLAAVNRSVPEFVAKYRIKNLARDYALAPLFEASVWLEETITGAGRWTYSGEGIQEMGANYFRVAAAPGSYYAGLVNDDGSLEIWGIGVNAERVEAFPLGRGGSFDTTGYDDFFVMVFNPVYDDDMTDCVYQDYDIDFEQSKTPSAQPSFSFPSTFYRSLREGSSGR